MVRTLSPVMYRFLGSVYSMMAPRLPHIVAVFLLVDMQMLEVLSYNCLIMHAMLSRNLHARFRPRTTDSSQAQPHEGITLCRQRSIFSLCFVVIIISSYACCGVCIGIWGIEYCCCKLGRSVGMPYGRFCCC